jgi:hypothetical protein
MAILSLLLLGLAFVLANGSIVNDGSVYVVAFAGFGWNNPAR